MSKLSGLVLVLAGAGIATYALPRESIISTAAPIAQVGVAEQHSVATQPSRTSTSVAAVPDVKGTDDRALPPPPKPEPAVRPVVVPPIGKSEAPSLAAPASSPAAMPPPFVPPAAKSSVPPQQRTALLVPSDHATLARELQRELKRVGCYAGEINGAWTVPTRKAMKAFTDRVNATLPIDNPDYILLRLVQTHQDKTCGTACLAGQTPNAAGDCVTDAIVARGSNRTAPLAPTPAERRSNQAALTTAPAPSQGQPVHAQPPAEGRMALAGPQNDARQPRVAPVVANDSASVARHTRKVAHAPAAPSISVRVYEKRRYPRRYAQRMWPGDSPWARTMYRRYDTQ